METVNHSSLNARRRSPVNASTRSVSTHRRGQFRTLQPVHVRLSSAATEAVAATRPLSQAESSGILQEPGRLQLYDGYRRWRKRQLRNAKRRLLAVVAARDLRASCASASEPLRVERIHVLIRSSIGDWKNIIWYRDKRNGRSQKRDSGEQRDDK